MQKNFYFCKWSFDLEKVEMLNVWENIVYCYRIGILRVKWKWNWNINFDMRNWGNLHGLTVRCEGLKAASFWFHFIFQFSHVFIFFGSMKYHKSNDKICKKIKIVSKLIGSGIVKGINMLGKFSCLSINTLVVKL